MSLILLSTNDTLERRYISIHLANRKLRGIPIWGIPMSRNLRLSTFSLIVIVIAVVVVDEASKSKIGYDRGGHLNSKSSR